MNHSPVGSAKIAQVAVLTKDIEAAKKRYAAVLDMPEPETIITQPGDQVRMTFRGSGSNAQAKLAFFNLENIQIELIEPMGGDSTWQEALDKHGESVHHIAFWVENMAERAAKLKELGIDLCQRGDMGDGQYAYFDAEGTLGLTLELLESKRTEI